MNSLSHTVSFPHWSAIFTSNRLRFPTGFKGVSANRHVHTPLWDVNSTKVPSAYALKVFTPDPLSVTAQRNTDTFFPFCAVSQRH